MMESLAAPGEDVTCLRCSPDLRGVKARIVDTLPDLRDDHLDRDRIVSASWNNDVCIAFARLDELQVHRLDSRQVLLDDLREGAAAGGHVALDPPDEADICVCVDEDLDVAQLAHPLVDEEKYSVDDDDVCG